MLDGTVISEAKLDLTLYLVNSVPFEISQVEKNERSLLAETK